MTTVSHIISSFEKYFEEHLVAFPIIKFFDLYNEPTMHIVATQQPTLVPNN